MKTYSLLLQRVEDPLEKMIKSHRKLLSNLFKRPPIVLYDTSGDFIKPIFTKDISVLNSAEYHK